MTDIKSMTMEELTHTLREMGQPAFRGGQVFTWLHRGVTSFEEMSDLPRALREQLAQTFHITAPTVARKQESRLDGTVKYLWELADGNCIETVLMQYHHGNTVCISSQVGCRMGCAFCASTIAGKVRDLTPSEMLDQVLFTQLDSGREISNIVLMGIGEPLDNMDTVLRFLTLVNHPKGLNIGMRHISLSTCGVIPGIRRLAELQLQLTLSVSLHAPDSETRSRIMPVNRAYDVEELFAACHDYFQKTGRRISFEYAMIDGVNDHDWQADLIARRIAGMPGHVNLIPLNDVVESPFKPSRRTAAFQKRLQSHGVTAAEPWRRYRRLLRSAAPQGHGGREEPAMRVWSVTDRGLVRSENQDACAVLTPDGYTVAVVCDGMGGTQGGRMASAIAVETFTRELSRSLRPGMSAGQLEQAAGYAVALSNDAVREYGLAHPGFERMGTTLVSAVVRDDLALVSNVGDSRAYHITREGIRQDHSVVEDMVEKGDLTRDEARHHPRRNLITRALGTEPGVAADTFPLKWQQGDFLLLCSDGLINTVSDQELLFEVIHSEPLDTCLDRLLALSRQRGAPDNVTAVLLMNI